jgi:hypothetical protein
MSYLAAALAIVGMAQQMFAGQQQADDIMKQQDLQRQIDALNADAKLQDAYAAETLGYTESARYQSVIDKTLGEQTVAFAAEGVDVTSGTARAIAAETRLVGRLNVIDMQRNARAKASRLKLESANIRMGAYMSSVQAESDARAARTVGLIGATQIGLSNYDRIAGAFGSKATKE